MLAAHFVTVIVNGAIVSGSTSATICAGVVVAPVAPYVRRIAQRIEPDEADAAFVFERAGRTIRVALGSSVARSATRSISLPIAPYLRAGEAIIPLAAVARALGAQVDYDSRSRTLDIELTPEPLLTPAPPPDAASGAGRSGAANATPAGWFRTFEPTSTPVPAATVTGIPRPRRTPILVAPSTR